MIAQTKGAERIQCPWCPVGLRRSMFSSVKAFGQHAGAKHSEKLDRIPEDDRKKMTAYADMVLRMFPNLAAFPDPQIGSVKTTGQPVAATDPIQAQHDDALGALLAPAIAQHLSNVEPNPSEQHGTASTPVTAPSTTAATDGAPFSTFACQLAPYTHSKAKVDSGQCTPQLATVAAVPARSAPPVAAAGLPSNVPLHTQPLLVPPATTQGHAPPNAAVTPTPQAPAPAQQACDAAQLTGSNHRAFLPVHSQPVMLCRVASPQWQSNACTAASPPPQSASPAPAAAAERHMLMSAVPGSGELPRSFGGPGANLAAAVLAAYPAAHLTLSLPSPPALAARAADLHVATAGSSSRGMAAGVGATTAHDTGRAQAARLLSEHNLGAFTGQSDELLQALFSDLLEEHRRNLRLVNQYFASAVLKHHVKHAGRVGVCLAAVRKALPSNPSAATVQPQQVAGGFVAVESAIVAPGLAAAAADEYELLEPDSEADTAHAAAAAAAAPQQQQQQQQQLVHSSPLVGSLKVNACMVQGSRAYDIQNVESSEQQLQIIEGFVASMAVQNRQLRGMSAVTAQCGDTLTLQGLVQELEQQQQTKQQLLNWLEAAPGTATAPGTSGAAAAAGSATVTVTQFKLNALLDYVVPRLLTNSPTSAVSAPPGLNDVIGGVAGLSSRCPFVVHGPVSRAASDQVTRSDNSVMLFVEITVGDAVGAGVVWEQLTCGGLANWFEKVLPVGAGMTVSVSYSSNSSPGVVQMSTLNLQGQGLV